MTQIYHETNRKFVSYHFLVSSSLYIPPTQTNEALDYQFIQGLVQINSSFTIRDNLLHPFSLLIYSCVFFYPHQGFIYLFIYSCVFFYPHQGLVQINSSFTIRDNLLHPFSLLIYSYVFFYPHKQQSELSNGLYKAILPARGVVKTLEKFSGVLPISHDGYYATALKKKGFGFTRARNDTFFTNRLSARNFSVNFQEFHFMETFH